MNKKRTYFKQKKAKNKTNVVLKSINSIKKTEKGKIIYFLKVKNLLWLPITVIINFFARKRLIMIDFCVINHPYFKKLFDDSTVY